MPQAARWRTGPSDVGVEVGFEVLSHLIFPPPIGIVLELERPLAALQLRGTQSVPADGPSGPPTGACALPLSDIGQARVQIVAFV